MTRDEAWISTKDRLPDDGVIVETKLVNNRHRDQNVQPLRRWGRLWFFPDGTMYVYYTPTHWRPMQ